MSFYTFCIPCRARIRLFEKLLNFSQVNALHVTWTRTEQFAKIEESLTARNVKKSGLLSPNKTNITYSIRYRDL